MRALLGSVPSRRASRKLRDGQCRRHAVAFVHSMTAGAPSSLPDELGLTLSDTLLSYGPVLSCPASASPHSALATRSASSTSAARHSIMLK